MDVVRNCKNVWLAARSDTERFAALFIIARLVESAELTNDEQKEIFDCVGCEFICRMLHTAETPEGCSPFTYKIIALAILSRFCRTFEIAGSAEFCNLIIEFRNLLNINLFSAGEEEKGIVDDTLDCIFGMICTENGRARVLETDVVPCLVNLYISDSCVKTKAVEVLRMLVFFMRSKVWENNTAFSDLMKKLCEEFCANPVDVQYCTHIFTFITHHPTCVIQGNEEWALDIQAQLTQMLRCRLTKEMRDIAIQLASVMIERCSKYWLRDETNNSKHFYLVIIHVACVEIQVILEGRTIRDVMLDSPILNSCFTILENMIVAMVDEDLWPLHEFAQGLIRSMRYAYRAVIYFLRKVAAEYASLSNSEAGRLKNLVHSTIRALCAWLAEETGVYQQQICEILPYVMKVCHDSFLVLKEFQEEYNSSAEVFFTDLMRFFLPALCHLSADEPTLAILLENNLTAILMEYFYFKWEAYSRTPSSEGQGLLCTACGIVLNIVVMEARNVSQTEEFLRFFKFLLNTVPSISWDDNNLCLKANFCTLGLLFARHHSELIKQHEATFHKFLSNSVKFIWDAHHVEQNVGFSSFVLVPEYRGLWADIKELWFLSIQALLALLPIMPWTSSFLMDSGWPQHIIRSLAQAEEDAVEDNIKCEYQALLSTLVRVNRDVVPAFNDCDALSVCKKHKMQELESLLV